MAADDRVGFVARDLACPEQAKEGALGRGAGAARTAGKIEDGAKAANARLAGVARELVSELDIGGEAPELRLGDDPFELVERVGVERADCAPVGADLAREIEDRTRLGWSMACRAHAERHGGGGPRDGPLSPAGWRRVHEQR
jgi:hypothetical protein